MESIREIFRIGVGPSSSHTMAPRRAATEFAKRTPTAVTYRVTLYGSLAATGRGHLTHAAIRQPLSAKPIELLERAETAPPFHPNGILFEALDSKANVQDSWCVYSVGGGALREGHQVEPASVYQHSTMNALIRWAVDSGSPLWSYVHNCEKADLWEHLAQVWQTMQAAITRGLEEEGVLPGKLKLQRKAYRVYQQTQQLSLYLQTIYYIFHLKQN